MRKTVQFKEWKCNINFGTYGNGRLAISLTDTEDGQAVATATANVPEEKLEKDEVIIKDYSENNGIHDALVDAEIIFPFHREVQLTFCKALVCKLNPSIIDELV